MENNNVPTFDIDSDVLRCLTFVNLLRKHFGDNVSREQIRKQDHVLYSNFKYYSHFLDLIKADKIRVVIGDAIFQESKHSKSLVDFMKEYAYFPDVNMVNYQSKSDEARQLAYAYCQPYTINNKEYTPPMKFVFIADINQRVPTNDAYAMAQATVEGRCFITGNGQDFIFNKRNNSDKYHNSRVKGITNINLSKGYYTETNTGSYMTPKPIHIHVFGAMIKNDGEDIVLPAQSGKIIKANLIIDKDLTFDEDPITI